MGAMYIAISHDMLVFLFFSLYGSLGRNKNHPTPGIVAVIEDQN